MKMFESIERTHDKLREAVMVGARYTEPNIVARMAESYEAKKTHYVPAVERVLAIIDRGVMDRLTVNGEILRLQSDMKRRWTALQSSMRDLDSRLEETTPDHTGQQLRDSISTILSSDRSLAPSTLYTPHSSPASSIITQSRTSSFGASTPTPTPFGFRLFKNRLTSGIPRVSSSSSTPKPNRPLDLSLIHI